MTAPTQHEHVWTDWVRPAVLRDSLGVVIGSPGLHVRLPGTDGPATPGWWRTCRTCPAEETVAASRATEDVGAYRGPEYIADDSDLLVDDEELDVPTQDGGAEQSCKWHARRCSVPNALCLVDCAALAPQAGESTCVHGHAEDDAHVCGGLR